MGQGPGCSWGPVGGSGLSSWGAGPPKHLRACGESGNTSGHARGAGMWFPQLRAGAGMEEVGGGRGCWGCSLSLTPLSVPGAMPAGGRELLVLGLLALGCAAANDFPEGVVGRRRPPGPAPGCPRDCGCTQEGVVDCGGIDLKEFPLLLPELTNHLSLQVKACISWPGSILPLRCVLEAAGPVLVLHPVPLAHLWVSHHLRISSPPPHHSCPRAGLLLPQCPVGFPLRRVGKFHLNYLPTRQGRKKGWIFFLLFSPQVQERSFCPK